MKVAIIGASHWHLPLYLDPLLKVPGASVVGVADPNPAAAEAIGARLGCAFDRDFRELCRRVKPNFVIAMGRHADMVAEAEFLLGEGIPFAIEKPAGLNADDVAGLAAIEARTGAFAAVPLAMRNGGFVDHLSALPGGPQYMTFRFIAGFPSRYIDSGCEWMLDPALSGGGCTINLAVHFFDLCHLLWGEGVEVRGATMSNAAWGHLIEDYSVVTLAHGRNICVIETGYLYPAPTSRFDMHFAVRSPDQYIVASDQHEIEILGAGGAGRTMPMAVTNVPNYPGFVTDVLDRVRRGKPPLARLADLLPSMRLIDAAYAAAGFLKGHAPP